MSKKVECILVNPQVPPAHQALFTEGQVYELLNKDHPVLAFELLIGNDGGKYSIRRRSYDNNDVDSFECFLETVPVAFFTMVK